MQHYSPQRSRYILLTLTAILFVISLYSVSCGTISTPVSKILATLAGLTGFSDIANVDAQLVLILKQIRIPRLLLGIIVGAGLAVSGCVLQALFRNPMADPGLLGVSSGAALGAITTIVLGMRFAPDITSSYLFFLLPAMAFAGGLCALVIVYQLAKTHYRIDIPTMLLAGVALNSVIGALIGLLTYVANDGQLRELIFWGLGSLEITSWAKLTIALIIVTSAILAILKYALPLNASLLGENEARHLGIDMEKLKVVLIVLVSMIVGVCVALSGIIGFVGLLVPHLLRLTTGSDHRLLLPACAVFGATLLVLADILARTLAAPAEIPIGIITSILGGPFFLWLLVRHRNKLAI